MVCCLEGLFGLWGFFVLFLILITQNLKQHYIILLSEVETCFQLFLLSTLQVPRWQLYLPVPLRFNLCLLLF